MPHTPPSEPSPSVFDDPLASAIIAELDRQRGKIRPATLHIVPTPIGNLADVTLRGLTVLRGCDVILCEDTRHTSRLLTHYGLRVPLLSVHEHNESRRVPDVIARLADGQRVALVSDAGMPLVSDPGYRVVRASLDAGHNVTALPGPSAPVTALAMSGMPVDRFLFAGFLANKQQARRTALADLASVDATLVFFESPNRLPALLQDCEQILGSRSVAIAREISKLHETIWTGSLHEAVTAHPAAVKGEVVVIVGSGERPVADDDEVRKWIATRGAEKTISVRDLAREAADRFSIAKKRAYQLALEQRESNGSG